MSFATASQFSGGTIFRITMYPSSSHVRQFSAVMTVSSSSSIEPPSEEALQAFFSRSSSSEQVESNISNVEVKNAKANGVNKNLAKLRSLKQGSE